jgi:hypothetical protein
VVGACAVALVAASARVTAAEEPDPNKPVEIMTLPKGAWVINGFIEMNLSKGSTFKPVSITPDAWYGIDDKISAGLVHSSTAMTGFVGGVGDSLCVTGVDNGCPRGVYKTVGGLARYRLKAPYIIEGGLVVSSTQPFLLDLKLGWGARWRFKKYTVELGPNLFVAITQRSSGTDLTAPHSERLNVPATGGYAVSPKLALQAQLGFSVPFNRAGDYFTIPFAFGGRYVHNAHLSIGLMFALPGLISGGALAGGFDIRTLTLGVSYAK